MNKQHGLYFIIIVSLLSTILTSALSQGETPTPAPTKTTETITQDTPTPELEVTNNKIRTFTQTDLSIITGNVQRPNGAVWFDSKIYILCSGDKTIYQLDDTTGSTETYIFGPRNSHSLYAEEDSNQVLTLWVPDFESNQLLQVNSARTPQPIASQLEGPWGIVPFDANAFLVTGFNNDSIYRITRDGTTETIISELRSPTGIALDETNVYFANSGSARRAIEWFGLDEIPANTEEKTTATETAPISPKPLVSGLQNTTGIVMASDDMLYFAYSLGTRGVVGRVDPLVCVAKGGCTNDEVEVILYTELAAPLAGLTISPDMRLFIHTMFRPEIYWLQLDQ